MKYTTQREIILLRTFAISAVAVIFFISSVAFKGKGYKKLETLDVERINIIEPDGSVKMVITNVSQFPNGTEVINGRPVNKDRKKRSGMLFFNEDGIECGGFIYDGTQKADGHSAGLSLTYDQYDGDQVMQLLTTDVAKGEERMVTSALTFNDRAPNETQEGLMRIMEELDTIQDRATRRAKYKEYEAQGLIGAKPRIMLGKTRSQNNGLFLFDAEGRPKAMFYIDKENNVKLEAFDNDGNVISSWPK
jgi:hypothetical protein